MDPFVLFAIEGALLQLFTSVNGFANNLFATALGSTDVQISLIQMIPNAAAMLLLLPLGILAERLRSSRTIPLACLICIAGGYLLMAAVPAMGNMKIAAFFFALVFTAGIPAIYNAQWQPFFGDVVPAPSRNSVLTLRNRAMFAIGILTPLAGGAIMQAFGHAIQIYTIFFLVCAGTAAAQAAVVASIPVEKRQRETKTVTPGHFREAAAALAGSRAFRLFFIPVVLFYMTWQMDWSMWYLGQVKYLHLTESQITVFSGIFNVGQLAAIGLLSRSVRRRGCDRTLPFAALGLLTCPITMIICTMVPQQLRMPVFTILVTVLNAPQCAANLCIVQILLQAAPKQYRSIAVSVYTVTITLTNCLMPYLGVQLYTVLGADYRALILFNIILAALRISAFFLLLWRSRHIGNATTPADHN